MKHLVTILVVCLLMAGSFVWGAREGVEAFLQRDAQYRASMTAYYLEYLDNQRYEELREILDTELDLYLIRYIQGTDNPLGVVFPELDDPTEQSLKKAAHYRLSQPGGLYDDEALGKLDEPIADHYRALKPEFDELLTRYGQ